MQILLSQFCVTTISTGTLTIQCCVFAATSTDGQVGHTSISKLVCFFLRTRFHGHTLSLRTPSCHNDYDAVSPQTAIARQTVREATTGGLVHPNAHQDDHHCVRCVLSCIAPDTAPLFLVHLTPFTIVYTPSWIAPSIKVQCYVIPVVESTSLWFPIPTPISFLLPDRLPRCIHSRHGRSLCACDSVCFHRKCHSCDQRL